MLETAEEIQLELDKLWGNMNLVPETQNIVYTTELNQPINLNFVFRRLLHLGPQFNRKKFPALVFRRFHPGGALLLFAKGKIVCTGAKTDQHAREHINSLVKTIVLLGYKDLFCGKLEVHNMVGAINLMVNFDLKKVSTKLSTSCGYNPSNFPGAAIRPIEISPAAILTFESGNIVITGVKSTQELKRAFDYILPTLRTLAIPKGMKTCLYDHEEITGLTPEFINTINPMKEEFTDEDIVVKEQPRDYTNSGDLADMEFINNLKSRLENSRSIIKETMVETSKKRKLEVIESPEIVIPPKKKAQPMPIYNMPSLKIVKEEPKNVFYQQVKKETIFHNGNQVMSTVKHDDDDDLFGSDSE